MKKYSAFLLACLVIFSCEDPEVPQHDLTAQTPQVVLPEAILKSLGHMNGKTEKNLKKMLNSTVLEKSPYKITDIEVYTIASEPLQVQTVDQQFESTLPQRWVPNDTRRNWNGDGDLKDIDWVAFPPLAVANGTFNALPIYRAMYDKWENDGYCTTVDIDEDLYDPTSGNPSLILGIGGQAPASQPLADISVVGFIPGSIFEALLGSTNVLGVTFAYSFVDPATGQPVSTTRGKADKAYNEVWFNNSFQWSEGPENGVDLESVILHEFGHSMNLGHFGILQAFIEDDGSYDLVYQPVNTMNAIYIGERRNFLGPNDKGNYCESWGSWPWN